MAKKDKLEQERRKAREAAEKDLKERRGFPIAPRKAMSNAKKASKKLDYPLPPYAGASYIQLARWGYQEWRKLGRWQNLALPVILLIALLPGKKKKPARKITTLAQNSCEQPHVLRPQRAVSYQETQPPGRQERQ